MTANEMKYNFLLFYDKMFEYGSPAYDDRQVSVILTKAQMRVFKRHYMPMANRYQQGFEESEQRRRDLEQYIKTASISDVTISTSASQIGIHPNGTFFDLPSDFLYAIEESATLTGGTREIPVLPIRHDYYRANVYNPYKQPYHGLVWRLDISKTTQPTGVSSGTSKRVEVITDGVVAISDYRVRYLSTPSDIVCDEILPANQRHCILDDTLHDEIVDEAVKIAKASTITEEYQIADKEQKENES